MRGRRGWVLAFVAFGSIAVYLAARHVGQTIAGLGAGLGSLALVLYYEVVLGGMCRSLSEQVRLASIDDLTGLANDRSFREALKLPRGAGALALIDVDHFKAYNDAFGHPAGDEALRLIGEGLAEVGGPWARIYRVGGDEFAALFSEAGGPDPAETAQKFVGVVADHQWSLRGLTVSVGLARVGDGRSFNLLDRADRALYRAKHAGGNRADQGS